MGLTSVAKENAKVLVCEKGKRGGGGGQQIKAESEGRR